MFWVSGEKLYGKFLVSKIVCVFFFKCNAQCFISVSPDPVRYSNQIPEQGRNKKKSYLNSVIQKYSRHKCHSIASYLYLNLICIWCLFSDSGRRGEGWREFSVSEVKVAQDVQFGSLALLDLHSRRFFSICWHKPTLKWLSFMLSLKEVIPVLGLKCCMTYTKQGKGKADPRPLQNSFWHVF